MLTPFAKGEILAAPLFFLQPALQKTGRITASAKNAEGRP